MNFTTYNSGGATPVAVAKDVVEPDLVDFRVHAVFAGDTGVVLSAHEKLPGEPRQLIVVGMTTDVARFFAKAIVDAADKIDVEMFVERPLQKVDCE